MRGNLNAEIRDWEKRLPRFARNDDPEGFEMRIFNEDLNNISMENQKCLLYHLFYSTRKTILIRIGGLSSGETHCLSWTKREALSSRVIQIWQI